MQTLEVRIRFAAMQREPAWFRGRHGNLSADKRVIQNLTVMSSPYDQALQFLLGRLNYERTPVVPYGPREFKLERMRELLRRLGNPQDGLPIVHIAGTKGKGSTAAMIASVLSAAGYRTGLYTSPHLERIEERVVIDGLACSALEFAELVEAIRPVAEAMDRQKQNDGGPQGPTFFELTTAMALLHFARRDANAVVLEVGMGGRLDSTNVCRPRVAVITNISFDHTKQLGNTLAKIAREKAGIIKPGVPVICGVTEPEPLTEIERIAAERGSPLLRLGRDFDFNYRPPRDLQDRHSRGQMEFEKKRGREPISCKPVDSATSISAESQEKGSRPAFELGLLGRHQAANGAVALATMHELIAQGWRIPEEAMRRGLAEVRWPARIEVLCRHPTLILDSAHNLASIRALIATLAESFSARRRILVFATTSEKDVTAMVAEIMPHFDRVIFTRYVNNPRGVPPEELERLARDFPTPRLICPDPASAWDAARESVGPDDLLCITGSFFLAAEMRTQIAQRPLNAQPVLAASAAGS
jgi:dihydrofolate synthase/folylpolyglutamate synthase